ncbi:MAG TPA: transcription termination/antitermination NusG family protein, partial [Thermoanaerobaculia bacterium]|nr:transcription termination/antitermination NusG family protein [Thermoanaerobaculia bacterium]
MDWYIVHTYSGFEDRVVQELTNRIKAQGMESQFGEIRVPKETVVEMKAGKRRNVERKFFPGYVLVQME